MSTGKSRLVELLSTVELERLRFQFARIGDAATSENATISALQVALNCIGDAGSTQSAAPTNDLNAAAQILSGSESDNETPEMRMIAARLFSVAGLTTRAQALLDGFPHDSDDTSIGNLVQTMVVSLARRDFESLHATAEMATVQGRNGNTELAPLWAIAGNAMDALCQYVKRPTRLENAKPILSEIRLLRDVCEDLGDAELFDAAKWLELVARRALQFALLPALAATEKFSSELLIRLESSGVSYEIWPSQKDAISRGLLTNRRFVVSAPTSSGKTFTATLSVINTLLEDPNALVVYLVPYNALAVQIKERLTTVLHALQLGIPTVWTGAYEIDDFDEPIGSVLITTPEKFDSILRNFIRGDKRSRDVSSRLRCVIIDELHQIGIKGRGTTLELLIGRIIKRFENLRLLGVSAVIGNPQIASRWLAKDSKSYSASRWSPSSQHVLYYERTGTLSRISDRAQLAQLKSWQRGEDAAVEAVRVLLGANLGPVLVLGAKKDLCERIAERLCDDAVPRHIEESRQRTLKDLAATLSMSAAPQRLVRVASHGIAYHHAGLEIDVRDAIERAARVKTLDVICATTTLAEGIDLPFQSLVLPGVYFNGELLPRQMFQNIIGRVGRANVGGTGYVIICQPGKSSAETYARKMLFSTLGKPKRLDSTLRAATAKPKNWSDWDLLLRLDSQLSGLLCDHAEIEDPSSFLLEPTLLNACGKNVDKQLFVETTNRRLHRMETALPPIVEHNSPYRATQFGKTVATTGISSASCRLLYREVTRLAESESPWFSVESWLADDIRTLVPIYVQLATSTIEAASHFITTGFKERANDGAVYGETGAVYNWMRNGNWEDWHARCKQDRKILEDWSHGIALHHLGATVVSGFGVEGTEVRESEMRAFIRDHLDFYLWMLSAAIRISEYVIEERALRTVPLRRALSSLKHGTSSGIATLLIERGLARLLSTRLVACVGIDVLTRDDDIRRSVATLGTTYLSTRGLTEAEIGSIQAWAGSA